MSIWLSFLVAVTLVVFLTGGFIVRHEDGRPMFEISQLAPFGILFALTFFVGWKRDTRGLLEVLKENRLVSRITGSWNHLVHLDQGAFSSRIVWGALAVSLFYLLINAARHFGLRTGFDLAIFDQAVFNSARGSFHFSQIKGDVSLFSNHFQPILLGFVPLYRLIATPLWLLAAQSLVVLFSVLGLHRLAKQLGLNQHWSLAIVCMFALAPHLRGTLINDFHPISLAIPVFIWLFYFIATARVIPLILMSLLLLLIKETLGIYLAAAGVYVMLFMHHPRKVFAGLILVLMGAGAYALVNQVVMPHFGQTLTYLPRYSVFGDSYAEIGLALLNPVNLLRQLLHIEKIKYAVYLFGSFGFLAFFAPRRIFVILPFLAQNLLTDYNPQHMIGTHYGAEGVAICACLSVFGLANILNSEGLRKSQIRSRILTLCLLVGCITFHGRGDMLILRQAASGLPDYRIIRAAQRIIPEEATISCQMSFLPHFSHRNPSYLYPRHPASEYYLVSTRYSPWPLSREEFDRELDFARSRSTSVTELASGVYLIKN